MNETAKKAAAREALTYVSADQPLGVGSGSTVTEFIKLLAEHSTRPPAAVAASAASARLLAEAGIPVLPLEEMPEPLETYIDGADEVDPEGRMIKGGGGAHTREKLIARSSRRFVCIVDAGKVVERLGSAPVPLEVERAALSDAAPVIAAMGGTPELREGFVTDDGNPIVDVRGFDLGDPLALERELDDLPGLVGSGIFAERSADVVIVGDTQGNVRRLLG
jgi:ribose 5-phosphate isomerase A